MSRDGIDDPLGEPESDAHPPSVPVAIRGGAAVFNAGAHLAAHEAWEPTWLSLPAGPDRDLLQGLIQLSAAVHHARTGNTAGVEGLVSGGLSYLADLGQTHRGVALRPLRAYLRALGRTPTAPTPVVTIAIDGAPVAVEDLTVEPLTVAAAAVAAHRADGEAATDGPPAADTGDDGAVIDERALIARAAAYARADIADAPTSPFVGLLVAYVRDEAHSTVLRRLRERVRRRRTRDRDVDGLFDVTDATAANTTTETDDRDDDDAVPD